MNAVTHTLESKTLDSAGSLYANRLLGVWSLVTYTDEQSGRDDTHPFGTDPQGFLIYTPDGFVSAQLMRTLKPASIGLPSRLVTVRKDSGDSSRSTMRLSG